MFEKVGRSLKYDSNYFGPQTLYIYIYIIYRNTNTDHFTPTRAACGGGKRMQVFMINAQA